MDQIWWKISSVICALPHTSNRFLVVIVMLIACSNFGYWPSSDLRDELNFRRTSFLQNRYHNSSYLKTSCYNMENMRVKFNLRMVLVWKLWSLSIVLFWTCAFNIVSYAPKKDLQYVLTIYTNYQYGINSGLAVRGLWVWSVALKKCTKNSKSRISEPISQICYQHAFITHSS